MQNLERLPRPVRALARTAGGWARRAGKGLVEISQNSLAALGLAVVSVVAVASWHGQLVVQVESHLLGWLQSRHVARAEASGDVLSAVASPEALNRATAVDPAELTRQQAAVAQWLSRRYKVAPEPIGRLVQEAWTIGAKAGLDPTLILAVMAVESSFNPFAQSPMGAQGLMQVLTRVHDDKYERFGGSLAAFDPLTNLRVGVQVLKECIARAGSLEAGLRHYVGAANLADDGGYGGRVMLEKSYLRQVADGGTVPVNAPTQPPEAAANRENAPSPTPSSSPTAPSPAAPEARTEKVALLGR